MKTDDFEWDDVKAEINRRAHKVTFEQACDALSDPFMVDWIDDGQDEGEDRFCALGMVENRLRCLHDKGASDQDYFGAPSRTFRTTDVS